MSRPGSHQRSASASSQVSERQGGTGPIAIHMTSFPEVTPTHSTDGFVRCCEPIDYNHVWTAENDGTIKIRSVPLGAEVKTIDKKPNRIWVNCLLYVEGSVWAGLSDGFIRVFDTNGDLQHEFVQHDGAVYCLAYSEGRVYSGGSDWKIYQWIPKTFEYQRLFFGHSNSVRAVTEAPGSNQNYIFSASDDHSIRVWDPNAPHFAAKEKDVSCLKILNGHTKAVLTLEAVPERKQLWSGSEDHQLRVWSTETFHCLSTLDGHRAPITSITCIENRVWSGAKDGVLYVWNASTFTPIQQLSDGVQVSNRYIQVIKKLRKTFVWKVWSCTSDGYIQGWNAEAQTDDYEDTQEHTRQQSQRVKVLQDALYEHAAMVRGKQDQIVELEQRLQLLSDPHQQDELIELHDQNELLIAENDDLRKVTEQLRGRCSMADDLLVTTRYNLLESETRCEDLTVKNKELRNKCKVNSALKEEMEGVKKQNSEQEVLLGDQLRLVNENDKLRDQVDVLRTKSNELQQALEESTSGDAKVQSQIIKDLEDLRLEKQEKERLTKSLLEEKENSITILKQEADELRKQIEKHKTPPPSPRQTALSSPSREEFNEQKTKLEQISKEKQKMENEMEVYKKKWDDEQVANEALRTQIKNLQKKEKERAEEEEAKSKKKDAVGSPVASPRGQGTSRGLPSSTASEQQTTTSNVSEEEKQKLQNLQDSVNILQNQIDSFKNLCADNDLVIAKLEEENAKLKNERQEKQSADALATDLQNLKEQCEGLTREMKKQEKQVEILRFENKELRDDKEKNLSSIESLEQQCDEWKERTETVEVEANLLRKEQKSSADEVEVLQQKLRTREQEIDFTVQQLDKEAKVVSQLNMEKQKLEKQISENNDKNNKGRSSSNSINEKPQGETTSTTASTQQQSSELWTRCQSLENQLVEQKEENAKLKRNVERSSASIETIKKEQMLQLQEHQKEREKLTETLNRVQESQQKKKPSSPTKEAQEQQQRAEKMEKRNSELEKKNQDLDHQIQSLRNEVHEQKEVLERTLGALDKADAKENELLRNLATKKEDCRTLKTERELVENALEKSETRVKNLQKEQENLEKEKLDLEKENEKLMMKMKETEVASKATSRSAAPGGGAIKEFTLEEEESEPVVTSSSQLNSPTKKASYRGIILPIKEPEEGGGNTTGEKGAPATNAPTTTNAKKELSELKERISQLEKQNMQLEEAKVTLHKQSAEESSAVNGRHDRLVKLLEESNAAVATQAKLISDLQQVQETASRKDEQLLENTKKLEEAKKEVTSLTESMKKTQEEIQKKEVESAVLKEQSLAAERQSTQEKQSLEKEVAKLKKIQEEEAAEAQKQRNSSSRGESTETQLRRGKQIAETKLEDTELQLQTLQRKLEVLHEETANQGKQFTEERRGFMATNEQWKRNCENIEQEKDNETHHLKLLIVERNHSIDLLNGVLEKKSMETSVLEAKVDSQASQLRELEAQLQTKTNQLHRQEKELEEKRKIVNSLGEQGQILQQAQANLDAQQKEIEGLQTEVSQLKEENCELENQVKQYTAIGDKLSNANAEISRLTQDLSAIMEQRDSAQQEASSNKSYVQQVSELRVRVGELESETQRLRNEINANAANYQESLTAEKEKNEELSQDNTILAAEQVELSAQLAALEDTNGLLQDAQSHIRLQTEQLEQANQNNLICNEENESLKKRLQLYGPLAQADFEEHVQQLEQLLAEKSNLADDQDTLIESLQLIHQEDTEKIRAFISSATTESTTIQEKGKGKKEEGEQTTTKAAQEEIASLAAKLDALDTTLQRSEVQEHQQETEISELRYRLQMLERSVAVVPSVTSLMGQQQSTMPLGATAHSEFPQQSQDSNLVSSRAVSIQQSQPQPTTPWAPSATSALTVKSYLEHLSRLLRQKQEYISTLLNNNVQKNAVIAMLRKKMNVVSAMNTKGKLPDACDEVIKNESIENSILVAELESKVSILRRSNEHLKQQLWKEGMMMHGTENNYSTALTTTNMNNERPVYMSERLHNNNNNNVEFTPDAQQAFTKAVMEQCNSILQETNRELDSRRLQLLHRQKLIATLSKELAKVNGQLAFLTKKVEDSSSPHEARKSEVAELLQLMEVSKEETLRAQAHSRSLEEKVSILTTSLCNLEEEKLKLASSTDSGTTTSCSTTTMLPLLQRLEETEMLLSDAKVERESAIREQAELHILVEQANVEAGTARQTVSKQESEKLMADGRVQGAEQEIKRLNIKLKEVKKDLESSEATVRRYISQEEVLKQWAKKEDYLAVTANTVGSPTTSGSPTKTIKDNERQTTSSSPPASPTKASSSNEATTDTNAMLLSKLRILHQRYQDAVQRNTLQERTIMEQESKNHQLSSNIQELTTENETKQRQCNQFITEKEESEKSGQVLKTENEKLTSENKSVVSQHDELKTKFALMEDEYTKEKEKWNVIQKEVLPEKDEKISQFEKENIRLETSNKLFQKQTSEKDDEISRKQNFITDLQKNATAVRENFEKREEIMNSIEKESVTLLEKLRLTEEGKMQAEAQVAMLEERSRRQQADTENQITQLKTDLESADDKNTEMKRQLNTAQEETENMRATLKDNEFQVHNLREDATAANRRVSLAQELVLQLTTQRDSLQEAKIANEENQKLKQSLLADNDIQLLYQICEELGFHVEGTDTSVADVLELIQKWKSGETSRQSALHRSLQNLEKALEELKLSSSMVTEALTTTNNNNNNNNNNGSADSPNSQHHSYSHDDDQLSAKIETKTSKFIKLCMAKEHESNEYRREIQNLKRRLVALVDADRNKGELIAFQTAELDRIQKEDQSRETVAFLTSTRQHLIANVYQVRQGILSALKSLTVHMANIKFYRDEEPDVYATLVPEVNDSITGLAQADIHCRDVILNDFREEEKIQLGALMLTNDGRSYSTVNATNTPHLPLQYEQQHQRGESVGSSQQGSNLVITPRRTGGAQREYSPAPESHRKPAPVPIPQKDVTPVPNLSANQSIQPKPTQSYLQPQAAATDTFKGMSPDQRAKLIQKMQKRAS